MPILSPTEMERIIDLHGTTDLARDFLHRLNEQPLVPSTAAYFLKPNINKWAYGKYKPGIYVLLSWPNWNGLPILSAMGLQNLQPKLIRPMTYAENKAQHFSIRLINRYYQSWDACIVGECKNQVPADVIIQLNQLKKCS